jgi:hypothetical protein
MERERERGGERERGRERKRGIFKKWREFCGGNQRKQEVRAFGFV